VSTRFPEAVDRNRALDQGALSKSQSADAWGTPNVFDNGTAPIPYTPAPAQDAPGGILGRLMQIGAFDPSNWDQPPAGGLLALLQQYMRNNPDGGATR
jgi:hypothetical protein